MPVVSRAELYSAPHLVEDSGIRHSLGWQDHRKAGPGFVVVRLTPFGRVTVKARFPLTEQGWMDAWRTLAELDPAAAAAVAQRLAQRAARQRATSALAELSAESMRSLLYVKYNGGSGPAELTSGQAYDVRFLSDRLVICQNRSPSPAAEIGYPDVEAVEASTTNNGRPVSEITVLIMLFGIAAALLGLLVLGLVGLVLGALVGGLIGAVIASASGASETTIRIKGGGNEFYFAVSGQRADALRVELSEPLSAIESARLASAPSGARAPAEPTPAKLAEVAPESVPDQLTKLASLLRQDLITREEFEQLKADVIAGRS